MVGLVHKQVRLPHFFDTPRKVAEKHHMVWPDRPATQHHFGFVRRLIPLLVIATDACADKIFPRFAAATGFGNNVVDRQRHIPAAAILTTMSIAAQDIFSGENNSFIRNTDVDSKADDARKRHRR